MSDRRRTYGSEEEMNFPQDWKSYICQSYDNAGRSIVYASVDKQQTIRSNSSINFTKWVGVWEYDKDIIYGIHLKYINELPYIRIYKIEVNDVFIENIKNDVKIFDPYNNNISFIKEKDYIKQIKLPENLFPGLTNIIIGNPTYDEYGDYFIPILCINENDYNQYNNTYVICIEHINDTEQFKTYNTSNKLSGLFEDIAVMGIYSYIDSNNENDIFMFLRESDSYSSDLNIFSVKKNKIYELGNVLPQNQGNSRDFVGQFGYNKNDLFFTKFENIENKNIITICQIMNIDNDYQFIEVNKYETNDGYSSGFCTGRLWFYHKFSNCLKYDISSEITLTDISYDNNVQIPNYAWYCNISNRNLYQSENVSGIRINHIIDITDDIEADNTVSGDNYLPGYNWDFPNLIYLRKKY